MTPFGILAPGRILFGRAEAAKAAGLIRAFGPRGLVVHGANAARAAWLLNDLAKAGCEVATHGCDGEPTLAMVEAAVAEARRFSPQWVVAIGGGAALDLGKAVAALIPAPSAVMNHLEVVGLGLPLIADPLPFIAIPTTAGTGAEATKNAVIGLPDHGRKVSLRDDRMLARLAIIDPALTDGSPRDVTLASGLDAIAQVIEPYVSIRANPFSDALARPAIPRGLAALRRLMESEDRDARDEMAWVSLCGGLALANSGLGAVHGLAGPIGGVSPAAHGAVCGALLGPVLGMNRKRATGNALMRLDEVCTMIGAALGCSATDAPNALDRWARKAGLPGLTLQGLDPAAHQEVAAAAMDASSMKGNPLPLSQADCQLILLQAAE
jgi:alcohol dehydrogenase class IV